MTSQKISKPIIPLPWLHFAFADIGLREIKGKVHAAKILSYWQRLKLPFRDDETPWCAAAVGAWLEMAGIQSTRKANAKSYLTWGKSLPFPTYGSIVVLNRGNNPAFGHVGFPVGETPDGKIVLLGANQDDMVCLRAFLKSRIAAGGIRYPHGFEPSLIALPLITSTQLSQSEA